MRFSQLAIVVIALFAIALSSCATSSGSTDANALPKYMIGTFEDDYGIQYSIDDAALRLLPDDQFHILTVNRAENYLILQNDSLNIYAPSLFTRIDYQKLDDMKPYEWAFCFSSFEAASVEAAVNSVGTDKSDLMKGCNGYPFSRMKRRGR